MRVLGVLGGRWPNPVILRAWAEAASALYAADSGADACLAAGLRPVVTGDLDSVESDLSGLRVVRSEDQYRSDCDKLLDLVKAEVSDPDLVLAGFEGDRLDHMLSGLSSIAQSGLSARILLDTGIAVVMLAGATFDREVPEGTTVSLVPLGSCRATMRECKWPVSNAEMSFGGFGSISNITKSGFSAEVHSGHALLVLTGDFLPW